MRNSHASSLALTVPGAFMKLVKGMRSRTGKPCPTSSLPLWMVRHSYYWEVLGDVGSESECITHYASWQAFQEAQRDEDLDRHLLVRFDWEEENDSPSPMSPEHPAKSQLKLYYFLKRECRLKAVVVQVTRSDEPDVRGWLRRRFRHLIRIWSPIVEEWEEGKE